MSERNQQKGAGRRRRVQAPEKMMLLLLVLSTVILHAFCVILFLRVDALNRSVERLARQLEASGGSAVSEGERLEEPVTGQNQEETGAVNTTEAAGIQTVTGNTSNNAGIEQDTKEETTAAETEEYKHKVYLTFDDGPSASTDEILDILKEYEVKATFFVVGKESESAKKALRRITEEGHTLGMHSYSHKYKELYDSMEAFEEDFLKLRNYLYEVTGVESSVYRFPGGSSNTISDIDMWEFADYLDSQGVVFYDWNISSGDGGGTQLDVDTLVENCTASIARRKTSVILMHDSASKKTTVEALPTIIENILAMEDTVILPITQETTPVQHIKREDTEE